MPLFWKKQAERIVWKHRRAGKLKARPAVKEGLVHTATPIAPRIAPIAKYSFPSYSVTQLITC